MRSLLLVTFVGLMVDLMFGWGMTLAPGLSLKNFLLYVVLIAIGVRAAAVRQALVIDLPQIHLLFGALILIAFLSWAFNSLIGSYVNYSPLTALVAWKGFLLDHYLFFLLFFLGLRSRPDILWLQKWILVFISIGNILTVSDAYNMPDLSFIETRHDGRVQGPLGQANSYGLFLAIFFPILIARAWSETGAWRLAFSVGAAATLWTLMLTVSRGAFVGLAVGSLFAAFYLRQFLNANYVKRILVIGLIALLGATIVMGEQYRSLIMKRTAVTAETGDAFEMTSGRTWIWARAIRIMLDEPLSLVTGFGWNTNLDAIGVATHNFYLWRFFELGIFGLLIFLGLMYAILYWARRAISVCCIDDLLIPQLFGFVFGFSVLLVGLMAGDFYAPWYFLWAYTGLAMRAAAVSVVAPQSSSAKPIAKPSPSNSRELYKSSDGVGM